MKRVLFWGIFLLYGPLALWARFYHLNNALIEPHPWRQTQTALTILHLFQGTATVWDYRSPLGGMLWNNVYEFPLYQWVVSRVMHLGLSLEIASRLVTLFSFLMSAFFSYLIIQQLFSRQIANWFLLIYLANPFGVIFSRVCLIDFFALAATTASMYGLIKLKSDSLEWKNWILFAFGGLIAGLAKINIWFFITASLIGLMTLEVVQQKNRNRTWFAGVVGILVIQLGIIFLWNYHRVTDLGSPADTPWLVGELSQRFELWRWKRIFWDFTARSLFYDWLCIPFLFGAGVLFKKSKVLLLILSVVFIAHTLIFFQVQTYHDYYLIACMPYLFLIAALGLDYLSSPKSKFVRFVWVAVVGLMTFKSFQLRFYYSPVVHDYRAELKPIYRLKEITDPKDIIYWDAKQGRFEIATYSERIVGLSETAKLIGTKNNRGDVFNPTAFHFDSKPVFKLMESADRVWLEGSPEFFIYRVAEVGKFNFSPKRHFAVLDKPDDGLVQVKLAEGFDTCSLSKPVLMPLPPETKQVLVSIDGTNKILELPGDKKFLNLPNQSDWGCRFNIRLILNGVKGIRQK